MSSTYETRIGNLFDAWWKDSFPFAPVNKQTRENFIAFGSHLLNDYDTILKSGDASAA